VTESKASETGGRETAFLLMQDQPERETGGQGSEPLPLFGTENASVFQAPGSPGPMNLTANEGSKR
jgi:hypothetical protein